MKQIILGITGTIGSGKSTASQILVNQGFKHLSVRHYLEKELQKENKTPNRDNLSYIANKIRQEKGEDAIIKGLYKLALAHNQNIVMESIRAQGEINYLQNKGHSIIAITADLKTRYERIKKRGLITDEVTFEKFKLQEEAENKNIESHKQNLLESIQKTNYTIKNDQDTTNLKTKLDSIIDKIYEITNQ